jgi:hypothetical protein
MFLGLVASPSCPCSTPKTTPLISTPKATPPTLTPKHSHPHQFLSSQGRWPPLHSHPRPHQPLSIVTLTLTNFSVVKKDDPLCIVTLTNFSVVKIKEGKSSCRNKESSFWNLSMKLQCSDPEWMLSLLWSWMKWMLSLLWPWMKVITDDVILNKWLFRFYFCVTSYYFVFISILSYEIFVG